MSDRWSSRLPLLTAAAVVLLVSWRLLAGHTVHYSDAATLALPLREALYAIWQQALDNIQRHAQASTVKISLVLKAAQGHFSICDDGQGSSRVQRQEAMQNGRFGLRSMQIRLETIGGRLTFQSEPGQGSCVLGDFPLEQQK